MGFYEKNGELHAEDIPLTKIATDIGSPCYVYSAAAIQSQYSYLKSALEKALPAERQPLLCYACKANSHIAVLSYLRSLGSGLEIVSEGELVRGLKAGFDPKKIVSTGVGKQDSEIKACLESGIHQINVESLPELHNIQNIASGCSKTAEIVFRLNPDVGGGSHDKNTTGRKEDKFGLDTTSVFEGFRQAAGMSHIKALGLSMHIGSQVFTVDSFKQAFDKLPGIVADLRAEGFTVSRIDIGGGFPIQYQDEKLLNLDAYAEWVRDIILPLDAEIIMEPGRFLVGNAGVLLTQVLYVKKTDHRQFLIIDAAMNDLIRPTLYDAYHAIEPVRNRTAEAETYDVVGPICETGDTFSKERTLPAMKRGDYAVIRSAGAYTASMASNYNTRPMAPEILVHGTNYDIIRPRQTYDELLKNETVPGWIG